MSGAQADWVGDDVRAVFMSGGLRREMRRVGDVLYVRADRTWWAAELAAHPGFPSGLPALVAGHWLRIEPACSCVGRDISKDTDALQPTKLLPPLVRVQAGTYDGDPIPRTVSGEDYGGDDITFDTPTHGPPIASKISIGAPNGVQTEVHVRALPLTTHIRAPHRSRVASRAAWQLLLASATSG